MAAHGRSALPLATQNQTAKPVIAEQHQSIAAVAVNLP